MSKQVSRLKQRFGLFLFWVSWLLWGVMLVIPFLFDTDATTITLTVTSLLVAAEASFAISLLLLGRPFYYAFKVKVKRVWHRVRGKFEVEEVSLD